MAQTQALNGHEVHACSLVRDPVEPYERNGVRVHPLRARNPLWITESASYPAPVRLANKTATVLNRKVASEFGALLDDIQPDVLHTHSMVELPPAVWDQAARRSVPIVHTLHDYDLLCIRGALFKEGRRCETRHAACRILSGPKRALHDRIDVVAAVSRDVLETHLRHGLFEHLPAERRHVVWNPAALNASQQQPRRAPSPAAPLRFGFLGRLVDEKGLGVLLSACRLLRQSGWTLQIAGDGHDRAKYEAQAQGMPVEFVGYVDAAAFLRDIDVLVCVPVWNEPFGLTTIEAYAAGCRVIGTDQGVTGEVVQRIDPGWTVPAGDIPALAAAMQHAMTAIAGEASDRAPAIAALLAQLKPAAVAQTYATLYHQAGARSALAASLGT